jgi:hypothetical protein
MCEVRSRKNGQEQKKKRKKKYSGQQQKEIDCDEPHPAPNEKPQPIQWTERPTGALVAVNSLWPAWPTQELGPPPLSLTWGCQQLKRSGLPLCCESKRKNAGSFVSVKHRKRAWQTKELVRKEPCA